MGLDNLNGQDEDNPDNSINNNPDDDNKNTDDENDESGNYSFQKLFEFRLLMFQKSFAFFRFPYIFWTWISY